MEMDSPARTAQAVFDRACEITAPAERNAYLDQACAGDPHLRREVERLLEAFEDKGSQLRAPAPAPSDTGISQPTGGTPVPLPEPLPGTGEYQAEPPALSETGDYQPGEGTPPPGALPRTVDYRAQPGALPTTGDYQPGESAPGSSPGAVDRVAPTGPVGGERPGTQIGPYTLIKELGVGGMGAVWLAEQFQPVRRRVALKIIKSGMDSAQVVARFEAERQALTRMDHPAIARFLDAGATDRGLPYYVMELVPGGVPLARFCNDNRLTVRERLELFTVVCQALQHAHTKGIIHRDLKPGNVLVARIDGRAVPKVIDFGLAKAVEEPLTEHSVMTLFGSIVGTFAYMSPEQADLNNPGVDTRTDVYALGVMLYELLTGITPLNAVRQPTDGMLELLRKIKEVEPVRPSAQVAAGGERSAKWAGQLGTDPGRLGKLLRGELDWITLRALEKDRERRYGTVSALADDVRRYLNDEPVEACPPSTRYRLAKFARKHRTLLGVAAAFVGLLVLGVVGLAVGIVVVNDARQRAEDARGREEKAKERVVNSLKLFQDVSRTNAHTHRSKPELRLLRERLLQVGRGLATQDDTPEGREQAALIHLNVAERFVVMDIKDEAAESQRQAIATYESLVVDFPKVALFRNALALCHYNLAYLLDQLTTPRKTQEAEGHYRRAVALFQQLAEDFPLEPSFRKDLADCYNNLGAALRDQGELAKAEQAYQQAVTLGEKLVEEDPGHRPNLAAAYQNLGNAVRDQGRVQPSLELYGKAIRLADPTNPQPEFILVLRNARWERANALDQLGRHKEASEDWQAAADLEKDGPAKPHLLTFQVASVLDAQLQAEAKPAGDLLYRAAAAHSQGAAAAAATEEAGLQQRHTRLALELLEKARAAGWFRDPQHVQQLREDRSFDTLPRDAFQAFLATLPADKPPEGSPPRP